MMSANGPDSCDVTIRTGNAKGQKQSKGGNAHIIISRKHVGAVSDVRFEHNVPGKQYRGPTKRNIETKAKGRS